MQIYYDISCSIKFICKEWISSYKKRVTFNFTLNSWESSKTWAREWWFIIWASSAVQAWNASTWCTYINAMVYSYFFNQTSKQLFSHIFLKDTCQENLFQVIIKENTQFGDNDARIILFWEERQTVSGSEHISSKVRNLEKLSS